ncbi:hypothetical protein FNAPI_6577 [Fusarium napiforme]|uniref:Uncharacterized protein n=1 Tax=Fusarium napiforme TaxID=42672 RepID=A0A8H5N704_9HYPO|nr:hypothetical protein FNAPI_6577 [Fusarium napiforme]
MPDFRPLFFIAKVLTCCCCCTRRKPENARGSNHPYGPGQDQRSGSSTENSSDYSEYSVPPAYPGGPLNLIHPDEFEVPDELDEVHGRDEFGFDLQKSRSLVPCPPTPRPCSPVTSEPATTRPNTARPSTAKPDALRPSTAESTTTKTISDEPVAGPSAIVEATATESVTNKPHTDEPGAPKFVVVEPITDKTALDISAVAESEATGSTTKMPVADDTSATKSSGSEHITDEPTATKSVAPEPEPEAEPAYTGPTETKTDQPDFVSVDLTGAGPHKSDIEASEVKDGATEASSDGVGPTENKDEDKGKDKVSE